MGSASLKVNEPSMEEILASIRRIIADDQEVMNAPEIEEPAPSPLKSVLELTERHISPILFSEPPAESVPSHTEAASRSHGLRGDDTIPFIVGGYEADQPVTASRTARRPVSAPVHEAAPAESLLSEQADTSVSEAFGRLASVSRASQPQTVEDLMKEMLRPMLKAWLDENLPSLVERLVQAEIERVSRGRA
jgi:cell pole-organizing protein PopZ